jgi:hypothetical protein
MIITSSCNRRLRASSDRHDTHQRRRHTHETRTPHTPHTHTHTHTGHLSLSHTHTRRCDTHTHTLSLSLTLSLPESAQSPTNGLWASGPHTESDTRRRDTARGSSHDSHETIYNTRHHPPVEERMMGGCKNYTFATKKVAHLHLPLQQIDGIVLAPGPPIVRCV